MISFDDSASSCRVDSAMHELKTIVFSGGVGGAKLALGLSKVLDADDLLVVANTADDFEHCGLSISPDLDTLIYTLAGVNDKERGWGLADESWRTMAALGEIGGETWFRLGDRDIATHLERTRRLSEGDSLTEVSVALCKRFAVPHRIVPMTDDRVRTTVTVANRSDDRSQESILGFQEYFVREQCQPRILDVRFEGVDRARPQPEMLRLLQSPALDAVVMCPSNPFVSIDPILSLPDVRRLLKTSSVPVVAVSPIIDGDGVKGPTAKMMKELGMPVTAAAVARYYSDFLDGYVIHESDSDQRSTIEAFGVAVRCTNTLMRTLEDRIDLADDVLGFCRALAENNLGSDIATHRASLPQS